MAPSMQPTFPGEEGGQTTGKHTNAIPAAGPSPKPLLGGEVVQLMSRLVSKVYRNEALSEKRLSRTR